MPNNWSHIYTKILPTLGWYMVWGGVFWWLGWADGRHTWWMLLILVALIIKDITQYAVQLDPIIITRYDLSRIQSWFATKQISARYYIAFLNRIYFFPFVLTVYLIYLLIQQTQLRDRHLSIWYLLLDETFLLVLTILSWLWLVYQDDQDDTYKTSSHSLVAAYMYYYLSAGLGILSTYIIYQQVQDLDTIWSLISVIAWVLVFLVWVLLIQEEEEEEKGVRKKE